MAKRGRKPVIRACPRCGIELTARQMQAHECTEKQAAEPKELTYEPIEN